jgi:hypothetical protein
MGIPSSSMASSSRALLDSTPLQLATSAESEHDPVVTSSGNQFLVSWLGDGGALRATRVTAADGAVLDNPGLSLSASPAGVPSVAFDGTHYRVAWQSTSAAGREVHSRRVSPQNGLIAGTELNLAAINPSSGNGAGLASTGEGRFLVPVTRTVEVVDCPW